MWGKSFSNTNALGGGTFGCSAGVLTGGSSGDEDIAATALSARLLRL